MKKKLCIILDEEVVKDLKIFCEKNGYKISNLIELAIKDKMEKSKGE